MSCTEPTRPTRVLSLCSGVGQLERAMSWVVESSRVVAYVEREAAAVEVLAARMEDGQVHPAPVWLDLRRFCPVRAGVVADWVTAGFPCQPFSVAGRRRGDQDERWLWDDVWRVTLASGARFGFYENVPGLRTRGLERVLRDVARHGWNAEWCCVSAADVGAHHRRERLFILAAHPGSAGLEGSRQERSVADNTAWGGRPSPEPTLPRVADGLARGVAADQTFLAGNGVVPQQAEYALRTLAGRLVKLA